MITPAPSKGQRSRKDLACTADATAYQRQFVADLKRRVIDNGEPFAIAQADTPHEIFHAMDIPLISNQWWSAYISAKQLSPRYFEVLDKLGYPVATAAATARWVSRARSTMIRRRRRGADLPKPTVLVARLTCECIRHVFGQWAEALGSEFFPLEAPGWTHKDPDWFTQSNARVGRALRTAPHRIAGSGDARAHRAARGAHRSPLRRGQVRRADARRSTSRKATSPRPRA